MDKYGQISNKCHSACDCKFFFGTFVIVPKECSLSDPVYNNNNVPVRVPISEAEPKRPITVNEPAATCVFPASWTR